MAKPKLTGSVVKALEAGEKAEVVICGQLPGFGVSVRPSGAKSFVAIYRLAGEGRGGKVRKVTIGRYPAWTADKARTKAEEILAKARLGIDVAGDKAKDRASLTVAQLCDEYLSEGCEGKKPSTLATDRGRIERHIKPLLGSKRIGEIARSDVAGFMRDVANGKTAVDVKTGKHGRARVTGGKGAATRTVRLLGGIFSYAVERGYIETNPRAGVKVYADQKSERFLNSDELARLGDALREAETVGIPWQFSEDSPTSKHRPKAGGVQREVISPHALAAIRLLLLTGCRAGEILTLQWDHVDFERGFLNLADSKTGAKKVWLGAPALAILSEIPRIAGNPYVIVGERAGKPRSDLKRPWNKITAHAGLADLRLHDLRHSFASTGAQSGMGLHMVGKLLGHASASTTSRYAHFAATAERQAANSIAGELAAKIGGSNQNINVLTFAK